MFMAFFSAMHLVCVTCWSLVVARVPMPSRWLATDMRSKASILVPQWWKGRKPERRRYHLVHSPTLRLGQVFSQGDLRDYRDGRQYGAVLALFHVISYQTTNVDLHAAMATAAANLAPNGVLIFDCWYGPGVLTDPPVTRVRRLRGDGVEITRIAEPAHFPNESRVDVHYEVIVEGPAGAERIRETHPMRYLFVPEIDLLLESAGLCRLDVQEWVTGADPAMSTWNICVVAGQRKSD